MRTRTHLCLSSGYSITLFIFDVFAALDLLYDYWVLVFFPWSYLAVVRNVFEGMDNFSGNFTQFKLYSKATSPLFNTLSLCYGCGHSFSHPVPSVLPSSCMCVVAYLFFQVETFKSHKCGCFLFLLRLLLCTTFLPKKVLFFVCFRVHTHIYIVLSLYHDPCELRLNSESEVINVGAQDDMQQMEEV